MKNTFIFLLSFLLFTGSLKAQKPQTFRHFGAGFMLDHSFWEKCIITTSSLVFRALRAAWISDTRFQNNREAFQCIYNLAITLSGILPVKELTRRFYRETTWKWAAFHIPLLLRYTFTSGKIRPFAEVGPTLRLRRKLTIHDLGYGCGVAGCSGRDFITKLQSETTKDPVIITAAAGVEIDIWKVMIPIFIRLQEGMSTFEMKEMRADAAYYDRLKTSTIQITAGISF